MNLNSFEKDLDSSVILSRGLAYYRNRSVLSLEMICDNHYKAKVAGTRLYEVTATLDDDLKVEEIHCTCPYDWGEYCKHEVAFLFALRHTLDSAQHEMLERPKDVDLKALLEKRSKEELLSFLLEYAKKDPSLTSALVRAFPSSDTEVNLTNLGVEFRRACDRGIESTSEEDEYGWDDEEDWQLSTALHQKIAELLGMAGVAITEGNIRHGGSIASMVVHELSALNEYEGETLAEELGDAIAQVATLFDAIGLKGDDASWLFSLFLSEADAYEDAALTALLRLCLRLAEKKSDQESLKKYLVALTTDELQCEGMANSTILNSLELQYALLLKQQKIEEAQRFALDNLAYEGMRKIAFDHALEINDYDLAEKLALENEVSPYRFFDTLDWSVLLFLLYQQSGNKTQMRSLAKEFLLHDNLAYYPILKESYEPEEWKAVVDGLLDELQERDEKILYYEHRKSPYPEILKAEGKLERLLAYIQKKPRMVRTYQEVLSPHYKDEVFAQYRRVIMDDGVASTSRVAYNALASWLEELVAIGGGSVAQQCLHELEPRYMKRPAMHDEIRKVGLL